MSKYRQDNSDLENPDKYTVNQQVGHELSENIALLEEEEVAALGENINMAVKAALVTNDATSLVSALLGDHEIDRKRHVLAKILKNRVLDFEQREMLIDMLESNQEEEVKKAVDIFLALDELSSVKKMMLLTQNEHYDIEVRSTATWGIWCFAECHGASTIMIDFIPDLLRLLSDSEIKENRDFVIRLIYTLGNIIKNVSSEDPILKRVSQPIIKFLDYDEFDIHYMAVQILGKVRDKTAIAGLKKLLPHKDIEDIAAAALIQCGLTEKQIEEARREEEAKIENLLSRDINKVIVAELSPDQAAVYNLLLKRRGLKRQVFENTTFLKVLLDKQAWITINDPELAQQALQCLLNKIGSKRSGFDNVLAQAIGKRLSNLEETDFTYYADEILDAVMQFSQQPLLSQDAELAEIISKFRYSHDVKLRYVKREQSDLTLGDKCGDCTAQGSINFGGSLLWYINPAYQILKLSKGKTFIGKINFTLGTLIREDAIIIDAMEFNPQAQTDKPYYENAKKCFDEALNFLKELARKEKRGLFALKTSNSTDVTTILESYGKSLDNNLATTHRKGIITLSLMIPYEDIRKTLSNEGHEGRIKLFYQMLDRSPQEEAVTAPKNLAEAKLAELEHEVFNPAQMTNPAISAVMRKREFEQAAVLILADEQWLTKIRAIFKLPATLKLSPNFLTDRLKKIYAAEAISIESFYRTFNVESSSFVRLA